MRKGSGGKPEFLHGALVFALALTLIAPGVSAKERTGARIRITKIDGTAIEGELVAVKGYDLVILERSTSNKVTESLLGIKKIKIIKTSEKVLGAAVLGAASAVICAYAVPPKGEVSPGVDRLIPSRTSQAIWGGIAGIGAGLLYVGERQNFRVKAGDHEGLVKIVARLRKRARERG